MKILVRIILSIMTVVLVMGMVIAIILVVSQKSGNTPYFLNYTGFVNTGTSMLPVIKEGDFVLVKKQDSYETGDVISYKTADLTVTHRIVEVEGDYYKTKGDNNTFIDGESVNRLSVYGKMVGIFPGMGAAIIYIMENQTMVIIILAVLALSFAVTGIGIGYVRKRNS